MAPLPTPTMSNAPLAPTQSSSHLHRASLPSAESGGAAGDSQPQSHHPAKAHSIEHCCSPWWLKLSITQTGGRGVLVLDSPLFSWVKGKVQGPPDLPSTPYLQALSHLHALTEPWGTPLPFAPGFPRKLTLSQSMGPAPQFRAPQCLRQSQDGTQEAELEQFSLGKMQMWPLGDNSLRPLPADREAPFTQLVQACSRRLGVPDLFCACTPLGIK